MNKRIYFISCCFLLATAFILVPQSDAITENDSVADVLQQLGDSALPHYPNTKLKGVSAQQGKQLVLTGFL
ncbi:MAG: hypothetical protein HC912_02800 [Saprospiraceae bacterium]|nr:hypothetical protein [Saprospiraceae bacterium]